MGEDLRSRQREGDIKEHAPRSPCPPKTPPPAQDAHSGTSRRDLTKRATDGTSTTPSDEPESPEGEGGTEHRHRKRHRAHKHQHRDRQKSGAAPKTSLKNVGSLAKKEGRMREATFVELDSAILRESDLRGGVGGDVI